MTGKEGEPRASEAPEPGAGETLARPVVDVRVTQPIAARATRDAGAGRPGSGATNTAGGSDATQDDDAGTTQLSTGLGKVGPGARQPPTETRDATTGNGARLTETRDATTGNVARLTETRDATTRDGARLTETRDATTRDGATQPLTETRDATTQRPTETPDGGAGTTQLSTGLGKVGLGETRGEEVASDDAGTTQLLTGLGGSSTRDGATRPATEGIESDDTELVVVARAAEVGSTPRLDESSLLALGLAARAAERFARGERPRGRAPRGDETRAGLGGLRGDETRASARERFDETRASAGQRFAGRGDETRVSAERFTESAGRHGLVDVEFHDEPPLEELEVAAGGSIGRFVVLRELGRGAMGVVFAAFDEELDRKVAIKLLHAGRGADASMGRSMLLREAQAMAKLSHPNVVAVHEVGVHEGAVFVAMEYVAGVDLQRWLAAETRPWREVLAVLQQAGAGLVAAHREGLVHRDFKPGNVLVGEDGRVRVADFGLATQRSDGGGSTARGSLAATLTGEGMLIGTPLYMAPELLVGGAATAESDQYAFCVALYEALYGARPFTAETLPELIAAVQRGLPTAAPRSEVPTWLYAAVARGLATAPGERWPSLAVLMDLLTRDPEAERLLRRRRALQIAGAIAATAAVVTMLVFAVAALRRYAAERQAEGRLAALRGQMTALRGRGEEAEAARLLRTFVGLPENRGTGAIAGAYLEWGRAEVEHAAAVDAYASAYIAALRPADGHAALRGLIDRLSALGQVPEASAALAVLEREAPALATAPELREVRLASALARRDMRAARGALAQTDPGGWSPVLAELAQVTELPAGTFGGLDFTTRTRREAYLEAVDVDGDGAQEVVLGLDSGALQVFRRDTGLAPVRTISVGGPVRSIQAVPPVVAGEPLIVASFPDAEGVLPELRVLTVDAGGATRVLDAWGDGLNVHATTVDFDGDGARELYIAGEAYARKFWRLERAADGAWSRRSAHRPTDAITSDLMNVLAADLDGDERRELVVTAGPWTAYDVRVYKPTAAGELDQVARRAYGTYASATVARAGDRDVVLFHKTDQQIAPGRFPPDRPLGEPAGVYAAGLVDGQLETLGHIPTTPANGPRRDVGWLYAGDLDGDGYDEVVIDVIRTGLALSRWRPGQPLEFHVLAGLRPLLVTDLDGDRTAEIVAAVHGEPGRLLVLGAGSGGMPPLQREEVRPRPVPEGIADPVIAAAWARAEQLVAIGVPRRTAGELAAISGFAGAVAPDMLLRTAELYAQIGEDALAAEHFLAAATREDITPTALAGAARARQRLGEFAAAEALTRRRLALVPADARAAVEQELAALARATAPRPEVRLDFTRPLDERWRVRDPVAVRRGLGRRELAVWAAPTGTLAEYPLVWDGGPATLEVELDVGVMEWGVELVVEVTGKDDESWLEVGVGGYGLTESPRVDVYLAEEGGRRRWEVAGPRVRGRVAVVPGFEATICEVTMDGSTRRVVGKSDMPAESRAPSPGPVRLRVRAKVLEPGFVGRVGVREIRVAGFTPGEPDGPADAAAQRLVEGEFADVVTALADARADDARALWRIEALLGLGRVAAAEQAIAALLAASDADGPAYLGLYQRLRREDPVALLAARGAFGARLIDVLLLPGATLGLRPGDIEEVLVGVPAPAPADAPADAEALQRMVLSEYARGLAHEHGGQLAAARADYAAAFARLAHALTFPLKDRVRKRLLDRQLRVAVAMRDRAEALRWVRVQIEESPTPYLQLERMQSDVELAALVGAEAWATLLAEQQAVRP